MTRCEAFYDKFQRDGNWCDICKSGVSQIVSYLDLLTDFQNAGIPKKFTIVNFPEGAARVLITEKNKELRERLKNRIEEALRLGQKCTIKYVRRLAQQEKRNGKLDDRRVPIGDLKPDIRFGDFRKLIRSVLDSAVDHVVTDPPYDESSIELWTVLGREAARVLKPSGFLMAYSGLLYLPSVLQQLCENLSYYWLFVLHFERSAFGSYPRVWARHIFQASKAVLVFQKPPLRPTDEWVEDFLVSPSPDKDLHEHGQNIEPIVHLLKYFTHEGDTVLDPFAGGGSTIEACLSLKRNVIAFEIDKERYDLLRKRFGGNGCGEVS